MNQFGDEPGWRPAPRPFYSRGKGEIVCSDTHLEPEAELEVVSLAAAAVKKARLRGTIKGGRREQPTSLPFL